MSILEINYVSPRYTDESFPMPLSIDNAITLFEDQVQGWFLDIARKLTEDVIADFVVLMIIVSYFEAYEVFRTGKDSKDEAGKFFKSGLKLTFRAAKQQK